MCGHYNDHYEIITIINNSLLILSNIGIFLVKDNKTQIGEPKQLLVMK